MRCNIKKLALKRQKGRSLMLAGDIGATKTNLGIFQLDRGIFKSKKVSSFPSRDYQDLKSILKEFIKDHHADFDGACFGIAGPINKGICKTTNLPWVVDRAVLKRLLRIKNVSLINDMQATANGIHVLPKKAFAVLNPGKPEPKGNIAVLAAGTGLGEGMVLWNGKSYRAEGSEGGHADFAPCNKLELDLCRYLFDKFGHSSYERVLSGPGLLNIYQFLKEKKGVQEPAWLTKELAQDDPGIVITETARHKENKLCVKTMDLFCAIYGAEAGNLALKILARGGVYLGGGIAPKILHKLQDGTFKKAFRNKGRFSRFLSKIPVYVILEEKTALYGAAMYALQAYNC
jgi:glucokinase